MLLSGQGDLRKCQYRIASIRVRDARTREPKQLYRCKLAEAEADGHTHGFPACVCAECQNDKNPMSLQSRALSRLVTRVLKCALIAQQTSDDTTRTVE